jgi:hypothetical protein
MVDQIAVVEFTTPASPGTLDITSSSITETFSAAILLYSGSTNDLTDNTHGVIGMGFIAIDSGAVNDGRAFGIQAQDNTSPSNTGTRHSTTDGCVEVPSGTAMGTAVIQAAFSAAIAGGVRVNFTTTTSKTKGVAILFAGLAKAYCDTTASATVGVSESVGGTTKFEPDLVIFQAGDAGVLNVQSQDAAPNIGFALNKVGLPQVCSYVNADDGLTTTDSDGFVRSANAYGHFVAGGSRAGEFVTVSDFTSTGFDHASSAGTPDANYLALKFTGDFQMAVANLSVAAATGDQAFTDFGFVPTIVLGMSTLMTTLDSTTDGPTAGASGYFVTGSMGSRAYTWSQQEGVVLGLTTARSRQESVAVLQYDHTGTVAQRATWVGASGATGFTLNFSVAASAGRLTALAIQAGDLTSVVNETEQITDGAFLNLISRRIVSETVQVSDGLGGMILADGLSALGPIGAVFQGGAAAGRVMQGGVEAAEVEE